MSNAFLENQLEIRAQRQKLDEVRAHYIALTKPHPGLLRSSFNDFSSFETPQQVGAYIREQTKSREIAFQLAITENALQKVQTAVRLIDAQRKLTENVDEITRSDVVLCIHHDMAQLSALFGKAARSVSKTKDIKAVADVLTHSILPLFKEVHEEVVRLYGPGGNASGPSLSNGQLIEEIAQQRLKFGEQILRANSKHLDKVGTTLNHVSYLEETRRNSKNLDTSSLEQDIDVRMAYLSSAISKCEIRVGAVRSYMETIYDMGAGEQGYFHPIHYNYAPLHTLF